MIKPPESDMQPARHTHHFRDEGVLVTVERFVAGRDESVSAEITFRYDPAVHPEIETTHIKETRLNLTSDRTISQIATGLEKFDSGVDWHSLIEYVAVLSKRKWREGEPVKLIGLDPPSDDPSFLLYPLLRFGAPTTIYGPHGIGKSYLSDYLALLVSSGLEHGRFVPRAPANVLLVDYEDDPDTVNDRLWAIKQGIGPEIDDTGIHYRYGGGPIYHEEPMWQKIVSENDIKLVIIDSMSGATEGELMDASTNSKVFNMLRRLKVTSLIIDHTGKEEDRGIIGVSAKYQRSRSIWRVQKAQEAESDTLKLGMYHEKENNGRLRSSIGLEFWFDEAEPARQVIVNEIEVSQVPELEAKEPLSKRIENLLSTSDKGKMTVIEILKELPEAKESSVRSTLSKGLKSSRWTHTGHGAYGLMAKHIDEEVS